MQQTATPRALLIGLATLVVALLVRLPGLASRDPWLDEALTQYAVSRDWPGLVANRIAAGHSPFYFALLKATGIDPANYAALRAVSAGFDAVAAGALAAGLARFVGLRAAVLTGLLYAFEPTIVLWAQNARPYALLMMFLALGSVGAMGLADRPGPAATGGGRDLRPGPMLLYAAGFAGAAATMTGGILAFASVALWPILRPRLRRDRAFLGRWALASVLPVLASGLVIWMVSAHHVADHVGNYFTTEDARPGLVQLQELWGKMMLGRDHGDTGLVQGLGKAGGALVFLVYTVFFVRFALRGARAPESRDPALPLVGLTAGYSLALGVASLSTSLLVERYFLPAWLGLMGLAGIGMALAWRGGPRVRALIVVMLALNGYFGIAQSLRGVERDPRAAPVAAIVQASGGRPVVFVGSGLRAEVRIETIATVLDKPTTPAPDVQPLQPGALDAVRDRIAAAERPVFVVAEPEDWQAVAGALPAPACTGGTGALVLAYWGPPNPAACMGAAEAR